MAVLAKKRKKKKGASQDWPLAIAIDTETTGLKLHHDDAAFCVSMMDEKGNEWFFEWEVDPFTREVQYNRATVKKIEDILRRYKHWVFHNTKFDVRALIKAGVDMEGLGWRDRYQDTVLASHVCCSDESHKLKDLGYKYFDISTDDEKDLKKAVIKARKRAKKLGWKTDKTIAVEADYWLLSALDRHDNTLPFAADNECKTYAMLDVKRTILLWMMYRKAMCREGLRHCYLRERTLLPHVYDMEQRGVTLNHDKLQSELKRYQKSSEKFEASCVKIASSKGFKDINLNSSQQVVKLLHSKEGFNIPVTSFTDSGNPSLDAKASLPDLLERTKGKANEFLVSYVSKKKDTTSVTYLTGYNELKKRSEAKPYYWRLHPSFNQTGTGTTRFSCKYPNTQNIGKGEDDTEDHEGDHKLRDVFGPAPGRIWYCIDYSQLQLRIFAYASGQKAMIRAFEKGYDFHSFIASVIFKKPVESITKNEKRVGKAVNFGFIFGAGPPKIERSSGMPGLYDKVRKIFPNAIDFMDDNMAYARSYGYVNTLGGYRLYCPKDRLYAATCYLVQGTEGDIVKNAMIDVCDYLNDELDDDHYLTMQVHDELVFDFPLRTRNKHKRYLRSITGMMQDAGVGIGVVTPVNLEVCETTWTDTVKISL